MADGVADCQGERDGADADAAAEEIADDQDGQLDRQPYAGDRPACPARDAGHPAVARAGPEPGRQIEAAAEADAADGRDDLGELPRRRPRCREDCEHHVDRHGDDDRVGDGAEARTLTQRDPAHQHQCADRERRLADRQRRVPADPWASTVHGVLPRWLATRSASPVPNNQSPAARTRNVDGRARQREPADQGIRGTVRTRCPSRRR